MKRRWTAVLVGAAAMLAGWAFVSADRCGPWEPGQPQLLGVARALGALKVGAGKAPLTPPLPVTVGGYGPVRSEASSAGAGLFARAVVLDVDGVRLGLVVVDTLLVTMPLVEAVRDGQSYPVWLVAAHTHSSLGGYDRRPVAQVAALGAFREDAEAAVVTAAKAALAAAEATVAPARLEVSQGSSAGLSIARSGQDADVDLTRLRFLGPDGAARAQWLVVSAHPTTVERRTTTLDADYPGRVAAEEETRGPVTLVLQGSGGNASVDFNHGVDPAGVAARVLAEFGKLAPQAPLERVDLGVATTRLTLPRPDGARLAPGFLRGAMENVLCAAADREVELDVLRLGPVSFLSFPGEPAQMAGQVLRELSGATRVLGNANGYVGYLEHDAAVRNGWGEAQHQYFGPELLMHLGTAARLAGTAAGSRARDSLTPPAP